ncbi:hypothetical protein BD626DRAFT_490454 [Schizophyllum amplum]|uniref:Uncharacterized protein n=1 Tax=Schizophyllum amplum TaxID=97359 RepID=A0A550CJL0_9AGAR|nr:hypothetical protein BD626DRAFT_490454 [Auriculariopsis ampla]
MTYQYDCKIPACLPELTFVDSITVGLSAMRMLCGALFRPDVYGNAQRLAPQPAYDVIQAIIDIGAQGQMLVQALQGLLEVVRQVLLPASAGPLEPYQDLIDVQCRNLLCSLNEFLLAVNFTMAAFHALVYTVDNQLSRAWNSDSFDRLLPAIRQMRKHGEALRVKADGMKISAEHIPERFTLSKIAELCGDSEHRRRELDCMDTVLLRPMADQAQKLEQYASNLLLSLPGTYLTVFELKVFCALLSHILCFI